MRIVSCQRDVSIPAERAGAQNRADIANLQAILTEEQSDWDTMEWQRFATKDIVHSTCAIDLDLQACVLASAELVNTVGHGVWRPPKFVRRHSFRSLRIDPEN